MDRLNRAHTIRLVTGAAALTLALVSAVAGTGGDHRATAATAVVPDGTVTKWIAGITRSSLEPLVNEYSGETPTVVGNRALTLTTRAEASGAMIDLAEQWVYEHLASYGLSSVTYAPYPGRGTVSPGRNIIGEIRGSTTPNNIVVISCHIDDRPFFRTSTIAYGADDGAGGCAAVLRIAQAFAGHRFANTIRFAFFNAEENGSWMSTSWGSGYYAAQAKARGERIVAMISGDSLAWNPSNTPTVYMVTRAPTKDPGGGDHAIAALWQQVVLAYGISGITPTVQESGDNLDDHGAFWNAGYPAVMLIEEDVAQVNPNWEQLTDRVSTFNWQYYVQNARSFLAISAHLAGFIA